MDKRLNVISENGGISFRVKVVPASSKTAWAGVYDGMLKIKVAAAPEKGKANKKLIEFLSDLTGAGKNDIAITSGLTSKVKQIHIASLGVGDFLGVLAQCR